MPEHKLVSIPVDKIKQGGYICAGWKKWEKMKVTPDEITSGSRYKLIRSIEYREIADFVISLLKLSNPVITLLLFFAVSFFAWAVYLRLELAPELTVLSVIPYTLGGLILLPLLMIPLHEALHILIFLLLGGKDIRIGADLRNFIVYVTAHRHVVSPLHFNIIAFFPFLVITAAHIVTIGYVTPEWKWCISLSLLLHTTMCAGDFAMAAFYFENRDKRILTWDDADEKIAYFYEDTEA